MKSIYKIGTIVILISICSCANNNSNSQINKNAKVTENTINNSKQEVKNDRTPSIDVIGNSELSLTIPSCELSSNYRYISKDGLEINGMLYGGRDYAAVIRLDFSKETFSPIVDALIYSSELNQFKREMINIYDYYKKWSVVVKSNDMPQIFQREIPIQITTIKFSGRSLDPQGVTTNPIVNQRIRATFELLDNKQPYCKLNFYFTFEKPRYVSWMFCEDDILDFIDAIENVIKSKKEYDNKMDNLFK